MNLWLPEGLGYEVTKYLKAILRYKHLVIK